MNSPAAATDWQAALAPSLDDFAALAAEALKALPEPFRGLAGEVKMQVEDFADEEILEQVGADDPFELTGLYQGADLANRSVLDPQPQISQVFLYRRPILDEWAERGDVTLGELIAHVLVHEIGHHFGLTDADIHAAEDED
jgi:predicted Zn-dependent protease with MMP-like domain